MRDVIAGQLGKRATFLFYDGSKFEDVRVLSVDRAVKVQSADGYEVAAFRLKDVRQVRFRSDERLP